MKRDERRFDELLHDALGRRGAPAPFPVDVSARVLSEIVALGPVSRSGSGVRQLAWLAAAAAAAALVVLSVLAGWAPSAGAIASGIGTAVETLLKLATPAAALLTAAGRFFSALHVSIQTVVRPLVPFQPLAQAMLAAIAAGMLGVTAFVVGRDVRHRIAE